MFIGGYFWELSGRKLQPTIKKSQPPSAAERICRFDGVLLETRNNKGEIDVSRRVRWMTRL